MIELLANYNDIVWVDPFGALNGPLLPHIYAIKESLTVYHPGLNLLPLPSLRQINEKRRLLQVYLYLLGREFEPHMVWIDDLTAIPFVNHYAKKGALSLFYSGEKNRDQQPGSDSGRLQKNVDLVYRAPKTPSGLNEAEFMVFMEKCLEEISILLDTKKADHGMKTV